MIQLKFVQEVTWFLKCFTKPKMRLLILFLITLIKISFFLGIPYLLKVAIDTVIPSQDKYLFFQLFCLLLVMISSLIIVFYGESKYISKIIVEKVGKLEIKAIGLFVKDFYKDNRSNEGTLLGLLTSNCSDLEFGLIHHLWPMLSISILGVCSWVLLMHMAPFVTLVISLILFVYYKFMSKLGDRLDIFSKEYLDFNNDTLNCIKEFCVNREEISLYNYKSQMIKRLESCNKLNKNSRILRNKYKRDLSNGGTVITEFISIVALFFFIPLIVNYGKSLGDMIAYLNLLTVLQWAVGNFSFHYPHTLSSAVSLYEINSFFTEMQQKNAQYRKHKVNHFDKDMRKIVVDIKKLEIPITNTNNEAIITPAKQILQNIAINIQHNNKVVIIGASGSGKSTTLDIIAGLFKNFEGDVHFGNQSIKHINEESFFESVAYVPQQSKLFNLSIKENLTLGLSNITDQQIRDMCIKVGIDKEINAMGECYESIVDYNAANLSGGQIKRLDIARALLKKPKVLLLDEPLAPLDPKAQDLICDLIMNLRDTTVLVVSHIMKFNNKADAVYKFENGAMVPL